MNDLIDALYQSIANYRVAATLATRIPHSPEYKIRAENRLQSVIDISKRVLEADINRNLKEERKQQNTTFDALDMSPHIK
jgi:hypothetical protein